MTKTRLLHGKQGLSFILQIFHFLIITENNNWIPNKLLILW